MIQLIKHYLRQEAPRLITSWSRDPYGLDNPTAAEIEDAIGYMQSRAGRYVEKEGRQERLTHDVRLSALKLHFLRAIQ